jgi:hypothetical protein
VTTRGTILLRQHTNELMICHQVFKSWNPDIPGAGKKNTHRAKLA